MKIFVHFILERNKLHSRCYCDYVSDTAIKRIISNEGSTTHCEQLYVKLLTITNINIRTLLFSIILIIDNNVMHMCIL